MKIVFLILLSALWIFSLFSFARWRLGVMSGKDHSNYLLKDLAFQAYLKISGLLLLVWIFIVIK